MTVIQRLLTKLDSEGPSKSVNMVSDEGPSKVDPIDFSATAVAEAMTLNEHALFSKIKQQEFVGQGWSKADKATRCPALTELIASFNKWSNYVSAYIINAIQKDVRSKRFAFWVEVHKQLFNLNNMSLAVAVGAAFDATPVYKLRNRNLIEVKSSAKKWLSYFADMLKNNNKAGYRKFIRKVIAEGDPGIPYIGSHLSDLTFIEDGNKNEVDSLVNFRKFHLIAKQVRMIDQLQKRKYSGLSPPVPLTSFCLKLQPVDTAKIDEIAAKLIEAHESGSHKKSDSLGSIALLSNKEDEFTNLTLPHEIVRLLDKEASCSPEERLEKWGKWKERYERQGEKFVDVWCLSDAWKKTVRSILENLLTEKETRAFRDLFKFFLMPQCEPESICDMLIAISSIEPDGPLMDKVVLLCDSLKKIPQQSTLDDSIVVPNYAMDVQTLTTVCKKIEESFSVTPLMAKSKTQLMLRMQGLAVVPNILNDLNKPLKEQQVEVEQLTEEREQVVKRIEEEKAMTEKSLEGKRGKIADLSRKEQELMEQLNRIKREREELEESYHKELMDYEVEQNNVAKKIEILETSIYDDKQMITCQKNSVSLIESFQKRVKPQVSSVVEDQLEHTESAIKHRVQNVIALLESFKALPKSEIKSLYKEFVEKVFNPLVHDLALANPKDEDLAKLKELNSEIH